MNSLKLRFVFGMALAVSLGTAMSMSPASADDQQPPAAGSDQAAPAAEGGTDTLPAAGDGSEQAAPSAEPAQDGGASAPEAPAEAAAPAEHQEAPAASEGAEAPASGASAVSASDLKIGAAVYGADGAKIGEVNGVKSDDAGKVQEILVTDGVAAGINAKVFAISGDKITSVSDGVKLSLSSEEAKKLPIIDNSNG
ncbi:PRC-barrel domain-containing protein [Hyphomicrobium facile]|uniref:PRC-barrel domain-containing protein n=1 Tax=Hyphomicrobium facile TaxID=51670 RepID=A0A1I7NWR8_9HYPH|nr:PRC-barrel domain-containing protein [Hyphomicrobium facile]SFV39038.1 PRC-barrel domain-containing protein [Hyphomicrobium facile]